MAVSCLSLARLEVSLQTSYLWMKLRCMLQSLLLMKPLKKGYDLLLFLDFENGRAGIYFAFMLINEILYHVGFFAKAWWNILHTNTVIEGLTIMFFIDFNWFWKKIYNFYCYCWCNCCYHIFKDSIILNQTLSWQEDSELLGTLRNPTCHLEKVLDENADSYLQCLSDAKMHKKEMAINKVWLHIFFSSLIHPLSSTPWFYLLSMIIPLFDAKNHCVSSFII